MSMPPGGKSSQLAAALADRRAAEESNLERKKAKVVLKPIRMRWPSTAKRW